MSKFRGVLAALVASVAFLVAASSASALTVSPAGDYNVFSENTQLALTSNGQALTCAESSIDANITSGGSGTIAAGNAVYNLCSNRTLGTFRVTQTSAWSLATTLTTGTVNLTVTVPASGAQIVGTGCTFWVEGTVVLSASGALPLAVNAASVSRSSLRISRNNGGLLCGAFPAGLAAVYTGDYEFDRTATVSG